jgi:GDP-L-fucose synthase
MRTDLKNKRIIVTGGAGFLGRFVCNKLKDRGYKSVFIARSKDYNLVELENVKKLYNDVQPDIVIHLAAVVGGIGANSENPGKYFYDNLMMGVQLIEEGRVYGIDKFICIGSVCAYPKFTSVPFKEEDLWDGYPEETNAPYGIAKKALLVQLQAYRQQYGFIGIYLLPVNLYGPFDNFDPKSSHVIPALIKKCFDAIEQGNKELLIWGTGNATREFLYVSDAAEGIVLATERYSGTEPVNLGAGFEISIKDLIGKITELTGFEGKIVWDPTKPDGQLRRKLDTGKAERYFNYKSKTSLDEGLEKTVNWYRENVLNKMK